MLNNSWTLYVETPQENWEDRIKKCVSFSTIAEFFALYSWLQPITELGCGHSYFIMREDCKPSWESQPQGGICTLTFNKLDIDNDQYIESLWYNSVVTTITEQMCTDLIIGITISNRPHKDLFISVWTSGGSKIELVRATNILKRTLQLPMKTNVEYKSNAKSMQEGTSHHRTERLSGNRKERRSIKSQSRQERLSKKKPVISKK